MSYPPRRSSAAPATGFRRRRPMRAAIRAAGASRHSSPMPERHVLSFVRHQASLPEEPLYARIGRQPSLPWARANLDSSAVASSGDLRSELSRLTRSSVPGLAVVIAGGDEIRQEVSSGLADLESGAPTTPDTVHLWFSMTKIVTATAAMQLAERGSLSLDDPVRRFVPEFPKPRNGWPEVLVRHLLSHSAGWRTRFRCGGCTLRAPRGEIPDIRARIARPPQEAAVSGGLEGRLFESRIHRPG